jgi:uroporphyrinogen decarboxylase
MKRTAEEISDGQNNETTTDVKKTETTKYPLKNDTLLRACRGQPVDHIPLWMMRQAGRYLPEFQQIRKEIDFFALCEDPVLAAEITIQPLTRYPLLDAVIIFSDILVIPQALGFKIEMKAGVGPVFVEPLSDPNLIDKMERPDVSKRLLYVYDAIRETLKRLEGKVPLIGFTGAPWTLFSYMIEGKTSKTWSVAKKWLYVHSEASHKLLKLLADLITEHLILQIEAGASVVQVFDSWAGYLSPEQYSEFCIPNLNNIVKRVHQAHPNVPVILFAKGAHYLNLINATDYDVISLDWTMDPVLSRAALPGKALQGNLDPCALFASDQDIEKMTRKMIEGFGV